jgi:hypothetical protein
MVQVRSTRHAPAHVAQEPLRIERENVALGDALDQEGAQLGRPHMLPLHALEAMPHDEVVVVKLLRPVVVEGLGSVAHSAVEPRDGVLDGMPEMGWDGMGWDGMGWDGMGWDGTG